MRPMRRRGSQAALTIIFALFGFMLATQFRARPPIAGNLQLQRAEELSVLLKVAEQERDTLRAEVEALRGKVTEMLAGEDQVKVLQEELAKARVLAGLTAVKGPGVVAEMSDSQKARPKGQDADAFLIHYDDVLKLVNELFASGAEAASVNGQRVVATTEIRCVGPVIMINGVRTGAPFIILAIGDPETLENSLKMRGGIVESLSFWGIEVKVRTEQEMIIPAYQGALTFRFAQPVKKEGTE